MDLKIELLACLLVLDSCSFSVEQPVKKKKYFIKNIQKKIIKF